VSDNALVLERVCKRFGDLKAVEELDLVVPAGSIYGFLGPNGAGKTTTLRMILDIYKPTSGSISVLGHASAMAVRERIGYLPEEKGLYKKMKAWSIIAYFATLKGLSRRDAKNKAFELLERYGLKDFANAKTEALSKGMGQKVQVLASIAHDPELVILDEPFSGLDPVNQQVMEEVIQDMAGRGRTILFSTHVMSHAERICDRVVLIAKGRKLIDGTIAEARRTMPRRIRIETADAIGPLERVAGVTQVLRLGDGEATGAVGERPTTRWELRLAEHGDPQAVLQACFENGINLRTFDQTEPSLHDVFVHVVGDEAREASFR